MSYDDALKLLKNTGVTVELVLSQIFQQNASNTGEHESYKRNEHNECRIDITKNKQNDVKQKEHTVVGQSYQITKQCHIKPKMISEDARNRNECMATVKMVPDLPKVGFYDGQFNHPTLHTSPLK